MSTDVWGLGEKLWAHTREKFHEKHKEPKIFRGQIIICGNTESFECCFRHFFSTFLAHSFVTALCIEFLADCFVWVSCGCVNLTFPPSPDDQKLPSVRKKKRFFCKNSIFAPLKNFLVVSQVNCAEGHRFLGYKDWYSQIFCEFSGSWKSLLRSWIGYVLFVVDTWMNILAAILDTPSVPRPFSIPVIQMTDLSPSPLV